MFLVISPIRAKTKEVLPLPTRPITATRDPFLIYSHKYSIGAVYLDVDVTKNIVTTSPSEGSILDDDGCIVDIVAAVGLNLMVAIDVFQWHSISGVSDVLVHKRLIHFVEGQEVVDTLQRDASG